MFNPLQSKTTAIITVTILKAFDNLSTWLVISHTNILSESQELNPMIHLLSSKTGLLTFDQALFTTFLTTALIVYITYDRIPLIAEALMIGILIASINNSINLLNILWFSAATDILAFLIMGVYLFQLKIDRQPVIMYHGPKG